MIDFFSKTMRASLLILFLSFVSVTNSYAYDFSAVCSTGQTLYYSINGDETVGVTYPGYGSNPWPSNITKPYGSLEVPETVTYGDVVFPVT